MSYIINKTDGSILTEITDGNIDQLATDLTLIGKSASAYGEYINENLVRLLENFANTTPPSNPMPGQLWYDTIEQRLKINDGYGFKLTSGTIVSENVPSSITTGDIWIDSKRHQLYFNDGLATILAGPIDPTVTGFSIQDVLDDVGLPHTVLLVQITPVGETNPKLLAIYSTDMFSLDPTMPIMDYTGNIKPGLNLNNSYITNIENPIDDKDVVNKITMENKVKMETKVITIDVSTFTGDDAAINTRIIAEYLNILYPANEYAVSASGPMCNVICVDTTNVGPTLIRQYAIINEVWEVNGPGIL